VTGLAIDGTGNVYFADAAGSRIRKVTPAGVISTVAGNGSKCDHAEKCGDGGLATATTAYLNLPESMAIDASGNLYIADAGDNRIRFVNMTGKPYTINGIVVAAGDIVTVAGTTGDITGCSDPQTGCGDGGLATSATLNFPYGVGVGCEQKYLYLGHRRPEDPRGEYTVHHHSPFSGSPLRRGTLKLLWAMASAAESGKRLRRWEGWYVC